MASTLGTCLRVAGKALTPVLFFSTLPVILLLRLWQYFFRGGKAHADRLRDAYPAMLDEVAARLCAACDGAPATVERFELAGALVHVPSGAAEPSERALTLEAVVVGAAKDARKRPQKLAVLLHGYPDTLACFEEQVPALVREGYRVVLPHLRGYGRSDRPDGWRNYRVDLLARDVVLLIERLGGSKKNGTLVGGHDWGGQVAWVLAHMHPEMLAHLVIVNSPHPRVFKRLLRGGSAEQMVSSWYMFFYQLPWVPELYATLHAYAAAKDVFGAVPGHTPADVRFAASAWLQAGSTHAMINYYRALIRGGFYKAYRPPRLEPLAKNTPVLLVWGIRDKYLVRACSELPDSHVRNGRLVEVDAGHFAAKGAPAVVNDAIVSFVRSSSS